MKVISVRKKYLTERGFKDFKDWNKNKNHIYIGRESKWIDGTFKSK
jgi:hypothetical protein